MKENKEFERSDIVIDRDMEVDCDTGCQITVYIETWFDVDRKFGTHIRDEEDTWLNLYGRYDPYADSVYLDCEIARADPADNEQFEYGPTEAEAALIKEMIAERLWETYGLTPVEFCESLRNCGNEIGGVAQ